MTMDEIFGFLAQALMGSRDFRVLRRLDPDLPVLDWRKFPPSCMGVFVDCETTGLDPDQDDIIELCILPFLFDNSGRIVAIGDAYISYNDTNRPISDRVMQLTGIDIFTICGIHIDRATVDAMVGRAAVVVAHNAAFDRKFLEHLSPVFARLPWACSQTQIDWLAEGFEGQKLAYLLAQIGYFYEAHSAGADCLAGITLLARMLPKSKRTGFDVLMEKALQASYRVWAVGAPFDLRLVLKARGYRWDDGSTGQPKAWHRDVAEGDKDAEIAWLRKVMNDLRYSPRVDRIEPAARFSARC